MKIVFFLGIAFILGALFYIPSAITGQAVKHGNNYHLEGDLKINGHYPLPARLTAYSNGRLTGEGGTNRGYSLTLYDWRESDSYNIYYGTPREQTFCTTLMKSELAPYKDLNCDGKR